jgi:two-component sensor histidine kinase
MNGAGIASILDVTERKRAESVRDLLVAELSHRVKNTLATVISIAHQSFPDGRALDEARRSFDERIRALAQTHARLAETSWSGISLATIVRDETAPYQSEGSNVLIDGPDITLNPKCAVSLGMAVHELTTNAAKYGALSTRDGALDVSWQLAGSGKDVCINWVESGVPRVAPPRHSGFGRLLLEGALAADLNGTVKLDFASGGLRCLIAFPLDRSAVLPTDGPPAGAQAVEAMPSGALPAGSPNPANGTRIMIVEDEFLLALELEEHLRSSGFQTIGPFNNLTRAAKAAGYEQVDVAVLDANLNGEMVYPVADVLGARGIPFILVTGYATADLPERFRALPRIAKPYDPATLTREIKKALAGATP